MNNLVENDNFQTIENTIHPSMKPLACYHGRIVKTFTELPSDGKFFEVLKRVILVVVAPFAYLVLGFIGIIGYPFYTTNIKKQISINQDVISKKDNAPIDSEVSLASEEERVKDLDNHDLKKKSSQKSRKSYSSETVKTLYAELKNAKSDYEKKRIYLKIAAEEIVQKNKKGASVALDALTKILDAGEDKYVNNYCEVARLRIQLEPDTVPYELEEAAKLQEKERNEYRTKGTTPPFYLSDSIMDVAECYLLLNDKVKVSQQIETMKEFADVFKNHNPHAYVGVFVRLAKFQIESNNILDASQIIYDIIILEIIRNFSRIDMRPSIENCVKLATLLIENGHIDEPVPSLINAAEKRFQPWKEKTGPDAEDLRELINEVKNKLSELSNNVKTSDILSISPNG